MGTSDSKPHLKMPGFDVERGTITQFWVKVLSNASDRVKGQHLQLTDSEVAKIAKRFGVDLPRANTLSGYQSVGVYPPSAQGAARSYKAERRGYHGIYDTAPLASLVNGVVARMTEKTVRNHVDIVGEDDDVPVTRSAKKKKPTKPTPKRKASVPKLKKVEEVSESDSDEDEIAVEYRALAALDEAAAKEKVDMSMSEANDLLKVVYVANRFGGRSAPKVVKHMLFKRIQKKNAGVGETKALKLAERVMEALA